jgi:hypothetical protein
MDKLSQLRDLAQRCAQLATETSDSQIIAALEKLRRELEAGAARIEGKYKNPTDA